MAEGKDLTKPKNMEEVMREKVRLLFMDMIPDESIDQMVMDEWERFSKGAKDRWGNRTQESDLQKIIKKAVHDWVSEELAPRINARISLFVQEHWQIKTGQKTWDDVVDQSLKELTEKIGGTLVDFLMADLTATVLHGVQSSISNMIQNRSY